MNATTGEILQFAKEVTNAEVVSMIRRFADVRHLVYEEVRSYGMPVGKETFDTVKWCGRFEEACLSRLWPTISITPVGRLDVKLHWCGSVRAKDSNVRQALIDFYGKDQTKGITSHAWSALAVAGFYQQTVLKSPFSYGTKLDQ